MPQIKLEIFLLPDLREIEDRLWFKIKLDDKAKRKPQIWQPPALDEHLQTVLSDKPLTVFDDRVKRLSEITGGSEYDCRTTLRDGKVAFQR